VYVHLLFDALLYHHTTAKAIAAATTIATSKVATTKEKTRTKKPKTGLPSPSRRGKETQGRSRGTGRGGCARNVGGRAGDGGAGTKRLTKQRIATGTSNGRGKSNESVGRATDQATMGHTSTALAALYARYSSHSSRQSRLATHGPHTNCTCYHHPRCFVLIRYCVFENVIRPPCLLDVRSRMLSDPHACWFITNMPAIQYHSSRVPPTMNPVTHR
jgi:hypothetical protein